MIYVTPNFHFPGNCKQAIELYKVAFGAEIKILLCNSDANPEDCISDDGDNNLVYHAEIIIGNQRIMMTDDTGNAAPEGNTVSLVLTFETADEVKAAYEIVSRGCKIIHPMQSTSYSSCFVSLIDKFGMRWELMTEQTEK
ncbi:PhnB protein [Anaerotaenia torta]|uniref:VOC family protein n=1 Tax=Anaerotaenia torta TaxID=433293 RepID=UPI003D2139AC